jgi:hypothetical protein
MTVHSATELPATAVTPIADATPDTAAATPPTSGTATSAVPITDNANADAV